MVRLKSRDCVVRVKSRDCVVRVKSRDCVVRVKSRDFVVRVKSWDCVVRVKSQDCVVRVKSRDCVVKGEWTNMFTPDDYSPRETISYTNIVNELWPLALSQIVPTITKKPFGNKVGKGENAGNQHFVLFPCFLPFPRTISVFQWHLFCRLQILSIWTSLYNCRLAKSYPHDPIILPL